MRSLSNACSVQTGEVSDDEVNVHLGNPGSLSICDRGEPPGDGRPGFETPSRPTPGRNAMASTAADHIVQGNLLVGQGQFDRAVAEYTEAIRTSLRSALAYMGRGVARAKAGQVKQAIDDQTEAIRIEPGLAAAFRNRGRDHWTRCGSSRPSPTSRAIRN